MSIPRRIFALTARLPNPSPRPCKRPASTSSRPRRSPSYSSHHARRIQEMEKHIDTLIAQPQPQPPPPTSPSNNSTLEKARQVFGSRLSGASDRARELEAASTLIAGIRVPPKPEEPDNCCMSGCVNCVWDRFRDELEDWAAASAEARKRQEMQAPVVEGGSMDDDGGGSDTLWSLEDAKKSRGEDEKGKKTDLFEGIPVGIRAFMELERKMKARRIARGEDPITGIDMETKAKWLER